MAYIPWRRYILVLTGLLAGGIATEAQILFPRRGIPERFRCWQPQVLGDRGIVRALMMRELLVVLAHEVS